VLLTCDSREQKHRSDPVKPIRSEFSGAYQEIIFQRMPKARQSWHPSVLLTLQYIRSSIDAKVDHFGRHILQVLGDSRRIPPSSSIVIIVVARISSVKALALLLCGMMYWNRSCSLLGVVKLHSSWQTLLEGTLLDLAATI
jgi:hypothetical protein